jgi:hypothetical protein
VSAVVVVILDGTPSANRHLWPAVPDQGHFVEIDAGGGRTEEVLVTRVVWRKANVPGDCTVDLHCKRATRGAKS